MIKRWIVTFLACCVVAAILVGYKIMGDRAAAEQGAAAPEYSETVEAALVETIDYQPAADVLGQVVAPQQMNLRTEVAGTISEVNFESGAAVKKGQLLIQLSVVEEQAQLQSAIARAELAQTSKKRLIKLRDSNVASQEQFDRADADLKIAQADQGIIEANIAKKTLRAPFDAIAGFHQFERGQYLEENTLITTLVGVQDFVWVDFRLSQTYAALAPDLDVTIGPLTKKSSTSTRGNWTPVSAKIVARESIIDRESRGLVYRAQIQRQQGNTQLLPNAIVSVSAPIAPVQSKLAVPAISVLHSSTGPYVFVLNPDDSQNNATDAPTGYRAKRQSVILGAQQGDLMIIESGLEEGQQVAAAGAFKLSDGLLTYLPAPAAAQGAIAQEEDSATEETL